MRRLKLAALNAALLATALANVWLRRYPRTWWPLDRLADAILDALDELEAGHG
jgi:hypothetical protein